MNLVSLIGQTSGSVLHNIFLGLVPSVQVRIITHPTGVESVTLSLPDAEGFQVDIVGDAPQELHNSLLAWLQEYAQGRQPHTNLGAAINFSALPPYTAAVLETLHSDILWGQAVSYGGLAAAAGRPTASRAAGNACNRNPFPLLVPCHRVLPQGGQITAQKLIWYLLVTLKGILVSPSWPIGFYVASNQVRVYRCDIHS